MYVISAHLRCGPACITKQDVNKHHLASPPCLCLSKHTHCTLSIYIIYSKPVYPANVLLSQTQHSVCFSVNTRCLSAASSRDLELPPDGLQARAEAPWETSRPVALSLSYPEPEGPRVWQLVPTLRPAQTICPGHAESGTADMTLSWCFSLSWMGVTVTGYYSSDNSVKA